MGEMCVTDTLELHLEYRGGHKEDGHTHTKMKRETSRIAGTVKKHTRIQKQITSTNHLPLEAKLFVLNILITTLIITIATVMIASFVQDDCYIGLDQIHGRFAEMSNNHGLYGTGTSLTLMHNSMHHCWLYRERHKEDGHAHMKTKRVMPQIANTVKNYTRIQKQVTFMNHLPLENCLFSIYLSQPRSLLL